MVVDTALTKRRVNDQAMRTCASTCARVRVNDQAQRCVRVRRRAHAFVAAVSENVTKVDSVS